MTEDQHTGVLNSHCHLPPKVNVRVPGHRKVNGDQTDDKLRTQCQFDHCEEEHNPPGGHLILQERLAADAQWQAEHSYVFLAELDGLFFGFVDAGAVAEQEQAARRHPAQAQYSKPDQHEHDCVGGYVVEEVERGAPDVPVQRLPLSSVDPDHQLRGKHGPRND